MAGLGIVFLCMGIGIILRYFRIFPDNASVVLNRFVIYVSLPAITILGIHRLGKIGDPLTVSPLLPALMAWIVLFLAIPLLIGLGRILGWDRKTTGAIVLTAGLGNTSFVGFALLEALYGPRALTIAILTDSPGTFLATATIGIALASYFAGRDFSWRRTARQVLAFPPFLTLFIALGLRGFAFPEALTISLDKLAATLIPLALISVGLELRISTAVIKKYGAALGAGLAYKLLLAPAMIYAIYVVALGLRGLTADVIVLESAMAPMITAGIIAAEYELRPELASLMLGVGIPLSLITVPALHALLTAFGV
jgi:predicted permease